MKIIDCFTFFNEIELLQIRLELLYNYVDKFVIVEANLTHSGNHKSFIYKDNIQLFEKYKDKITYIPVSLDKTELTIAEVDKYDPNNGSWILENQQRNAIIYGLNDAELNDVVLIGDLDEIPSIEVLQYLREHPLSAPMSLIQLFHYYYMNCQNIGYDRNWNGTVVVPYDPNTFMMPQYYRDYRNTFNRIDNGGWHFSYLGGVDRIKSKIESFAHTELNKDQFKDKDWLEFSINNGMDIFNRPGVSYRYVPEHEYPEYLRKIFTIYPQLIKKFNT